MSVGREEEKDYLKGRVGGAGRPWVGALYVHLRGGGWRWVGGGWADSARAWVVCDSHTNTGRSACSCLANTALYLFAAPNLDLLPLSNTDRWLSALLSFFFCFCFNSFISTSWDFWTGLFRGCDSHPLTQANDIQRGKTAPYSRLP